MVELALGFLGWHARNVTRGGHHTQLVPTSLSSHEIRTTIPCMKITPCFSDRWTSIEKPRSGIYADAFADAVRQLREKYPKLKCYLPAFEARGDVIFDTDRGELCWVNNETATTSANAGVEFRVLLMDVPQPIVSVEFEIDGRQAKMRWETEL